MKLHVDKYYIGKDGEEYTDQNGITFDSAKDLIAIGILNFCGCGDQDSALIFIRDVLEILGSDYTHSRFDGFFPEDKQGMKYFTLYMLDNLGLEEHGISTPGWLTDKGKEVLEDLQKLFPKEL